MLKRSPEVEELMRYPVSFALLTQIALRALRTIRSEFNPYDLDPGEALIGDNRSIGASKQQYRTAKARLQKWGLATFRATHRGTIACLTNLRVYDINVEHETQHPEQHPDQHPKQPLTRIEEGKKGRSKQAPSLQEAFPTCNAFRDNNNGTRASLPIPDDYTDREKEIIALWHEVAVASGLGFLPVNQWSEATTKAIAKYDDPALARPLFEWAVKCEAANPNNCTKSLTRVLNDCYEGKGHFTEYDYSADEQLAPDRIPF